MTNLAIEAIYRTDKSKSNMKAARREGFVTASIFGRNAEPVPILVNLADLVHQVKEQGGSNALIDVKVKGGPKGSDGTVIIKGFFKEPLSRKVLDIQFQRISMTEKLHVGVPVVLVGESAGVKENGILEQILDEIQVSCLPGAIPASFEVDVTGLNISDHLRAGEVEMPAGVEMLTDSDALVVTCVAPHVRFAAEEAAAETPAAGESGEG